MPSASVSPGQVHLLSPLLFEDLPESGIQSRVYTVLLPKFAYVFEYQSSCGTNMLSAILQPADGGHVHLAES